MGGNEYMFNIWLDAQAGEDLRSDDGGVCTGSYADAIEQELFTLRINMDGPAVGHRLPGI